MAEGRREARIELLEDFHVEARTRAHVVDLDEPEDAGGTDLGPRPTELFLMSLGACAVITIRMYARRKEWDLTGARVVARLQPATGKDPARIVQEIALEGELDAEQRERLRQIAGRCPVHRLLDHPIETEERLA
jgi:putative redox protein